MSRFFVGVLAISIHLAAGTAMAHGPVYFVDPNLKAAVEEVLHKADPTSTDMLALTSLTAILRGISDLTGLEYATNLEELDLRKNRIADVSPLSGLTRLRKLILNDNQITNVAPLAGLTQLELLDIHENSLSNISPLSGLVNLQVLVLRVNMITDLSAVAGMPHLRSLVLYGNFIDDISALIGLYELDTVDLRLMVLNNEAYCSHLQTIVNNNPRVTLLYDPNPREPEGLVASDGDSLRFVRVSWQQVCNGPLYTSHYRVWRAGPDNKTPLPVSPWISSCFFDDGTAEPGTMYTYWVQAAISETGLLASQLSQPDTGWREDKAVLSISSSAGGRVRSPGQGTFRYPPGQAITVQAEPANGLFTFAGWSGTAVEQGAVEDPLSPVITIYLNDCYILKANFQSKLDRIYVEQPNQISGSQEVIDEDGTVNHPFRSIQKAIEVAADGSTVIVKPGVYKETIDLLGKSILLTGIDLDGPPEGAYPIIDGEGRSPVINLSNNHGPGCIVRGFVITGGRSGPVGAMRCVNSSATIENCLIIGNYTTDPYGATISFINSPVRICNCTIADNIASQQRACMVLINSPVMIRNSIMWANKPVPIYVDGSLPSVAYCDVTGGYPGQGNMNLDPLFADPGNWLNLVDPQQGPKIVWRSGDYHLRSQFGRWDPKTGTLVFDTVTSPCLDAGDPDDLVGNEPEPNGGRINIGAYGGTVQASRSRW